MKLRTLSAMVSAVMLSTLCVGQKLGEGPAPFKPAKWLQGKPVTNFKDGRIHVVEFWAETNQASKDSLPTVAKLAKDYKGKVVFTTIAVPELEADLNNPKYAQRVEAHLKKAKVDLNVAIDQPGATTAKAWIVPAEITQLPAAFIIGRDAKVQWIGHPSGMAPILKEVVEGTWSLEKARAKEKELEEKWIALQKKLVALRQAMDARDERLVVDELDKIFVTDPFLEEAWGIRKFENLLVFDEPKAYAYAQKLADGIYKKNPEMLNNMAWEIVNDENSHKTPDYKLAVKLAEQSVALNKGLDSYSMDTLAYAYFKSGDQKKGIETQEKALRLAEKDKSIDKEVLEEMRRRLEIMKRKAGA